MFPVKMYLLSFLVSGTCLCLPTGTSYIPTPPAQEVMRSLCAAEMKYLTGAGQVWNIITLLPLALLPDADKM